MVNDARKLLDELHEKLLLHPDAGTTRMETGDFWNVWYAFERRVSELLETDEQALNNQGWQPIEGVPNDKVVDLANHKTRFPDCYYRENERYPVLAGWYDCHGNALPDEFEPTHYQVNPLPPQQKDG